MAIAKIHDVQTGEVVEREMTPEELEQWEQGQANVALAKRKSAEIAAAKAALLDRLGITEAEAQLLLS